MYSAYFSPAPPTYIFISNSSTVVSKALNAHFSRSDKRKKKKKKKANDFDNWKIRNRMINIKFQEEEKKKEEEENKNKSDKKHKIQKTEPVKTVNKGWNKIKVEVPLDIMSIQHEQQKDKAKIQKEDKKNGKYVCKKNCSIRR